MKQQMLYAALTLGLSVANSAVAEPVRVTQAMSGLLPAYEAATIVRSAGLNPISPAFRRGETYVLRAVGRDGREMRVVVDARYGEIMSIAPVMSAARSAPPAGGERDPYDRMDPYEPIARDDDLPPATVYRSGPPVVYEGDRPLVYERRPVAPIPNAPSRTGQRPSPPEIAELTPPSEQRIMTPERGEHGFLPPPPERFPQRAAPSAPAKPTAKPIPAKRAAAPIAPPLPKPRPAAQANPAPTPQAAWPSATDASPMPPPVPEAKPSGATAVPH